MPPRRSSSALDAEVPCPFDDLRMSAIITAEKRNVTASTRNAVAGPAAATIRPPSAGPTKSRHAWRSDSESAFTSTIWLPSTRSGISAPSAGPKNASPAA